MKLFKFDRLVLCSCVFVAALTVSVRAERMYQLNNSVLIQAGSPAADIAVTSYSVPSTADVDGDGLLDLVVGEALSAPSVGKVRFYRNIGSAAAPVYGDFCFAQTASGDLTVPRSGCLGIFPRMVDWNNDGKLDLLAGLGDGTVKIFLNIGTTTCGVYDPKTKLKTGTTTNPLFDNGTLLTAGPAGSKTTLDVGDRATPSFVDWNNDGKRDLIVGNLNGFVTLFLNQGADAAPDFLAGQFVQAGGVNLNIAEGRSSPVVVDADGDGRKDLIIGETNGKLYFYRNVGADAAPVFGAATTLLVKGVVITLPGSAPRSRPFVCDYNHDGRLDVLVGESDGKVYLFTSMSPIPLGGQRLAKLQNSDGGWDWPLDDGNPLAGTQSDTLGSVGLGLARAYRQTGDPDLRSALLKSGQLLLQKTDDFYANEGAFAVALDHIFNTTAYSTHVRTAFYDKLAAGTYYDAVTGTPNMTTASYIQKKRDRYIGVEANAAAWDLGLSLCDAASVGAPTAPWADAVKTAIEQITLGQEYDVLGLAGALYGLASAGVECDPLAGPFTAADNLQDLADILDSWQLLTGGFTYNFDALDEGVGNETLQETACAALALNAVDRARFWTAIQRADAYVASVQLLTGGWENFVGDPLGEDNIITADCLMALQMALPKSGDLQPDGRVDLQDLAILSENWDRSNCGACENADLNGDHAVNLLDLLLFSENWLTK
jgi:hypothetical protein